MPASYRKIDRTYWGDIILSDNTALFAPIDCQKNRRKFRGGQYTMQKIKQFFTEEKGQGMTEYGLILGLIALAAVTAMTLFGGEIAKKFGEVTDKLTGTSTGTTTTTTTTTP